MYLCKYFHIILFYSKILIAVVARALPVLCFKNISCTINLFAYIYVEAESGAYSYIRLHKIFSTS